MPDVVLSVVCKSCARNVVTVAPAGLVPATGTTDTPQCYTCDSLSTYYDAMQTADEEYASFKDRRDNYRPKQDALEKSRKAHMDFENWLISIDATVAESRNELERMNDESKETTEQEQGTKRSTPDPSSELISDPKRKRLKFSDSVEFKDTYRLCKEYARSDKGYIRGKYAAPDGSELLDTSGNDKSFLKFTGYKKVGTRWVDVWDENEEEKVKEKGGKKGGAGKGKKMAVRSGSVGEGAQIQMVVGKPRATRISRRRSGGLPVDLESTMAGGVNALGAGDVEATSSALVPGDDADSGNALQTDAPQIAIPEQQEEEQVHLSVQRSTDAPHTGASEKQEEQLHLLVEQPTDTPQIGVSDQQEEQVHLHVE